MNARLFPLLLALTLLPAAAIAGPADYVKTLKSEAGETELEMHFGSRNDGGSHETAFVPAIGYGVNGSWFTEVELELEHESGQGSDFEAEALEWENVVLLTEHNQYAMDFGLYIALERLVAEGRGWEAKLGPMFQTTLGKTQLNFNPILERKIDTGSSEETELTYQWQLKYRMGESFEPGLQGFGELGKWDDWEKYSEQSHELGPAIFGKFGSNGKHAIKYNAALLFGINDGAPDSGFRATIEYEFR